MNDRTVTGSDTVDAFVGLFAFLLSLFTASYLTYHLWLAVTK